MVFRADRLRGVFNHGNPALRCEAANSIHIGATAEQVHRHDGSYARMAREHRADGIDMEIERVRIDICEYGNSLQMSDAARGGEKRIRRRQYLIAGSDSDRHERQHDRIGTGGAADSEASAAIGRDLALEALDGLAQDELLRIEQPGDFGHDGIPDVAVLTCEVEKWNRRLRRSSRSSDGVHSAITMMARRFGSEQTRWYGVPCRRHSTD